MCKDCVTKIYSVTKIWPTLYVCMFVCVYLAHKEFPFISYTPDTYLLNLLSAQRAQF